MIVIQLTIQQLLYEHMRCKMNTSVCSNGRRRKDESTATGVYHTHMYMYSNQLAVTIDWKSILPKYIMYTCCMHKIIPI